MNSYAPCSRCPDGPPCSLSHMITEHPEIVKTWQVSTFNTATGRIVPASHKACLTEEN